MVDYKLQKHLHVTDSFNVSVKDLRNSCKYGSCNRVIEAKIGVKQMKNRSSDKLILNINSLRSKFDSFDFWNKTA